MDQLHPPTDVPLANRITKWIFLAILAFVVMYGLYDYGATTEREKIIDEITRQTAPPSP